MTKRQSDQVANTRERRDALKILVEKPEKRDNFQDLWLDGRMTLELFVKYFGFLDENILV